MMRYASACHDWRLSVALLAEMKNANLEIDSIMYNTALATCVSADQLSQASLLLDEMEDAKCEVDVIAYNTLSKGQARAGRMDLCFALFRRMRARGMVPSQVTYGI